MNMDATMSDSITLGIALILPVFVIFLYAKWVMDNKKERIDYEDADLAYYIGFMLTIFFLVITISFTHFDSSNLQPLLHKFSAGISSTFVGLGARLYLLKQISKQDSPEDAMAGILTELKQFTGELKFQFLEISTTTKSMAESFKNITKDMEDVSMTINESLKSLNFQSTIVDLNKSFKSSLSAIENAVKEIELQTTKTKVSTTVAIQTSEVIESSLLSINENINKTGKTLSRLNDYINDKLLESLSATSSKMLEVNQSQLGYKQILDDSLSQVNTSKNQLNNLNRTLKRNLDLSDREFSSQIKLLEQINTKIDMAMSKVETNVDYSPLLNEIKNKITSDINYESILNDIKLELSSGTTNNKFFHEISKEIEAIRQTILNQNHLRSDNNTNSNLDFKLDQMINRLQTIGDNTSKLIPNHSLEQRSNKDDESIELLKQVICKLSDVANYIEALNERLVISVSNQNNSKWESFKQWIFNPFLFNRKN